MGKAHQQQKWVFWVLVIFNKIAEEPCCTQKLLIRKQPLEEIPKGCLFIGCSY